jgi:hypothetical protein
MNLFFSAQSGDAWMLDPEDGYAVCLARDHQALPVPILETAQTMAVEWNADYRIDGEVFTVSERLTGSLRSILGYPTGEIQRVIAAYPDQPAHPAN